MSNCGDLNVYVVLLCCLVGLCALKPCSPSISRVAVRLHSCRAAAILKNIVTKHLWKKNVFEVVSISCISRKSHCFKSGSSICCTLILLDPGLILTNAYDCILSYLKKEKKNRDALCSYCLTELFPAVSRKRWLYVADVISNDDMSPNSALLISFSSSEHFFFVNNDVKLSQWQV